MDRSPVRTVPTAALVGLLVLMMSGCSSGGNTSAAADSQQSKAAIEHYRSYLEKKSAALVAAIKPLVANIQAGEVSQAQASYAIARVPYGQVEAGAGLFGDLNSHIDALAGEVPADEFGGFHRIEKGLWVAGTTKGLTPVAKRLLADVEELHRKVKTAELKAKQIADSATALAKENSTTKIAGKEERYSHIDLIDISASTEAAEAAFDAVKPSLAEDDPIRAEIEAQFEKIYTVLNPYGTPAREPKQRLPGSPGVIFVVYSELSDAAIRELDHPIDALAKLLSQVPAQVANG